MRIIFLIFVLFASLLASDAKLKYQKVVSNVERHYFKAFSNEEIVFNSINALIQSTPYLTELEKQKIKNKVDEIKSVDKKLKEMVEFLQNKGFIESEIYEMLIKSCMNSLDVHSRFLDKRQMQDLKIKVDGSFVGVGINLSKVDGSFFIVNVLENSPASKAGISISDKVLEINGVSCDGISLDRAIEILRGELGGAVKLIIKRGETLVEIELKREIIKVETLVFKKVKERILYFKISSFDAKIAKKISNKIKEHQGSSKAIILDLRGNPGGLVSQAIEVADIFLSRGNIMTQVGRNESDNKSFDASTEKTLTKLPLAILIDSNTASSAEILSGALQIHHRATLFGEKTFGKGSVESLYAINREESLSLTVAHYFLADSSSIEGVGILPDYDVNTIIRNERDDCLEAAKEFLNNKDIFTQKYKPQANGVCTKEEK